MPADSSDSISNKNTPPLEDDPCDVIAKAMRGLEISSNELTRKAGISAEDLDRALSGHINKDVLVKIAPVLGLSPVALTGLSRYRPGIAAPAGLSQLISPFGHAGVNAYVIQINQTALIFDTGTDATPIQRFLADYRLTAESLFITHRHHDHTAGVTHFDHIPIVYPEQCEHGDTLYQSEHGQLTALDVSGHLPTAKAYLFQGLGAPVCIIGDSVFAGSMGKTPDSPSYQLALQTARDNLLTLPPETILCPGHGPLTSVSKELQHNPFLNEV